MRGVFVSFEGGEGAGKSTLMEGIYQSLELQGLPVIQTRAPGGTEFGEKVRNLLLHDDQSLDGRSELFLFLADRAQHVFEVIKPALEEGKIVLCDRFNDSTIAYQGVARELDPSFVRSLCLFATKQLEPDLTFYLDIDPVEGLKRAKAKSSVKDRIESEALEFHQKIREAFLRLVSNDPNLLQQALDALSPFLSSCRQ